MPKKEVLERYDVLQFYELACALKKGDVQKFDEVIQRHESFFIECGIYLIVEKLKIIGYRNLFKRVSGGDCVSFRPNVPYISSECICYPFFFELL